MEERKMILRMLDEGKVTSNEAVELLKAVGETGTVEQKTSAEVTTHTTGDDNSEQTRQEKQKEHQKRESSTVNKFSGFLDKVITKLKDTDFDLNFGQSLPVDHVFQENDSPVDRINVQITNGGIQLHPWEEESVRVECHATVYRVQTQEEAKSYFMNNAHFGIESGELKFLVDENKLKVQAHMFVPKKMYEEIQLRTSNGSITAADLQTGKVNIRTSNGAVTLNQFEGNSLNASTSNGKIKLENGKWKKTKLETLNGAIRVDGSYEDVEAETLNGAITFVLNDANPGKASLKTVAGKIEMLIPEGLKIEGDLKATIGSLNCYLDQVEILKESKEVVQKRMSFIANHDAPTTYEIEAEAKTGSISIAKK
ncbi:DUF4097 domain-containing protein [Alkalihalobacillus sp. AL-G]|uniref:DUF4097 family beta strand repeat-containing protein n=1 Tax=Alkalihalobacillus sp. AL-G TaxID=2926399 RepID=UPI00272D5691|nr:DUF4097 domain-containing protein [Alkalihalobacillus sp. AL-G]WLD92936.1 DUF4097 domain-containing protein [Alkalihalobacillus sp. AL-G]